MKTIFGGFAALCAKTVSAPEASASVPTAAVRKRVRREIGRRPAPEFSRFIYVIEARLCGLDGTEYTTRRATLRIANSPRLDDRLSKLLEHWLIRDEGHTRQ